MNRIVFGISLIIGCFGQQDIVSTLPNVISATTVVTPPQNGIPNLPTLENGATESPQLSNGVSSLPPLVNNVPGSPQLPNGVTNLPSLVNGAPESPQLSNGVSNLPPLVNDVPGSPQLPNGVPNLPSAVNGAPELPQLSNGVSNLPPSVNDVLGSPQLPNGVTYLPSVVNGAPESPQLSNGVSNLPPLVNDVPGSPQLPNGIPNLPSLVNSVPGLPQLPNGVPNLLSSPAIPITTASNVLERPCRPNDLACIQRYFLYNGKCRPALGRVPDPLFRPVANKFYPRVNITQMNLNTVYKGLNNGRVQEFYINRDTDKVVLGIELRDLQNSCKDVYFRYHRRGREPVITHASGNVLFRSVYLTVTIPQVENLRLDESDSFVFSNDLPIVNLEPSLGQSSAPSVPVAYAAFHANMTMDVAEYFLTESSFLAVNYIQYVICDFGLQVI